MKPTNVLQVSPDTFAVPLNEEIASPASLIARTKLSDRIAGMDVLRGFSSEATWEEQQERESQWETVRTHPRKQGLCHERLQLEADSILERSYPEDIMSTIDFTDYLDGLYSYAVMLSRNRTQAEDLVQETCLRALRAMQRLRPDSNVKSWLFTILRNVWFNQLRQWRRAPAIVELESDGTGQSGVADTAKDPHATYVSNIEQEQVRKATQQLSIEHREIIILREYEELSYQEIATVLECPLGTVMSRLARARSELRDLLSSKSVAPRIGKESHNRRGDGGNMRLVRGG